MTSIKINTKSKSKYTQHALEKGYNHSNSDSDSGQWTVTNTLLAFPIDKSDDIENIAWEIN